MSLHEPIENRFMFWKMIKSETWGKSVMIGNLPLKFSRSKYNNECLGLKLAWNVIVYFTIGTINSSLQNALWAKGLV